MCGRGKSPEKGFEVVKRQVGIPARTRERPGIAEVCSACRAGEVCQLERDRKTEVSIYLKKKAVWLGHY